MLLDLCQTLTPSIFLSFSQLNHPLLQTKKEKNGWKKGRDEHWRQLRFLVEKTKKGLSTRSCLLSASSPSFDTGVILDRREEGELIG